MYVYNYVVLHYIIKLSLNILIWVEVKFSRNILSLFQGIIRGKEERKAGLVERVKQRL